MQFILSEEEYKKLIHKDRIKGPLKDLAKNMGEYVNRNGGSMRSLDPYYKAIFDKLSIELQTLEIKLDL